MHYRGKHVSYLFILPFVALFLTYIACSIDTRPIFGAGQDAGQDGGPVAGGDAARPRDASADVSRDARGPSDAERDTGAAGSGPDTGVADAAADAAVADAAADAAVVDAGGCEPNTGANKATCPWICPEICDGKDNDCDGRTDEAAATQSCKLDNATSECVSGHCAIVLCVEGFGDCDGEADNGCEASLDTLTDCGSCGSACTSECGEPTCPNGICTTTECDPSFGDCDCDSSNGCETSLKTLTDCGACGRTCSIPHAEATCDNGSCQIVQCASGYGDCDGNPANGCETPLDTVTDCKTCGTKCEATGGTASCSGGVCTVASCDTGFADCNGIAGDGCETQLNSIDNCGMCNAKCTLPNATASCDSYACQVVTCTTGYGNCDSVTSNGCETSLDSLINCGACKSVCNLPHASESCSTHACALTGCDPGWANCDPSEANGCETDIYTLSNCGGCGKTCDLLHATESCPAGVCLLGKCDTGWGDCDGKSDTGCEASLNTSINCQSCGKACALTNATASCESGSCQIVQCADGFKDCNNNPVDGCEINIHTLANCGACGKTCDLLHASESCDTGDCVFGACEDDWGDCDTDTATGCETSLKTSTDCGACGTACALANAAASCDSGACEIVSCNPGYGDCNHDSTDGCEAPMMDVTDGLAGYWSLDESSGLVAADTSGAGHNGALTNMSGNEWTAGEVAGALRLDGVNDYVHVGDVGSTIKSFSFWINSDLAAGLTAADTGLTSPTNYDSDSWVNPQYAYSSDDAYASMSGTRKSREWSGFAFGLPTGAVINGIQLQIEKKASDTGNNSTLAAELSWNGGNSYTSSGKSLSFSNAADDTGTLGGAADTWGRTWTETEFSAANFRIKLTGAVPGDSASNYIYVDQIQVNVYYTLSTSTGLRTPTGYVSGGAWGNPANAYTSNNAYATADGSAQLEVWTDFGFSVASGATINGIEARIEKRTNDSQYSSTIGTQLSWNAGTNWTSTKSISFTNTSDDIATVGSSTDTWGHTWTVAQLSNANFQIRLRGTVGVAGDYIYVDQIQINVYYTYSSTSGLKSPSNYNLIGWVNPQNAYSSDDLDASMSGTSKSQAWSGFNFARPGGSYVNGIEVAVEKSASSAAAGTAIAAEISWDGGNGYTRTGKSVSFTNAADDVYTFGGSTDTWGRSWSDSDLNAANFRVRLTGTVPGNSSSNYVYVDQIQVRLYYATGLASTGVKSPTATGNPNNQWTNPTLAYSSDDNRATVSTLLGAQRQDYSSFGFSIPAGSAAYGIQVKVEAASTAGIFGGSSSVAVELSWDGGTTYTASGKSVSFNNTADAILVYGGAADTWGRTWSASEFSNANFRVRLAATPPFMGSTSIDSVQVEVFYPAPLDQKIIDINGTASIQMVGGQITATNFPGTTAIYVDGAAATAITAGWHHVGVTDTTGVGASALDLGRVSAGYFDGVIDEVRLYDHVLTADEIAYLSGDNPCD